MENQSLVYELKLFNFKFHQDERSIRHVYLAFLRTLHGTYRPLRFRSFWSGCRVGESDSDRPTGPRSSEASPFGQANVVALGGRRDYRGHP